MNRFLAALVLTMTLVGTGRADEVSDFVDFQVAKLVTYADAHDQFTKTKRPVVVWVKATDDQAFDAWRETKDIATHVFVPDFMHVKEGFVVGGEKKGEFVVLTKSGFIKSSDMVRTIRNSLTPTPIALPASSNCPGGVCPAATRFLIQSNCPNGQCPRR